VPRAEVAEVGGYRRRHFELKELPSPNHLAVLDERRPATELVGVARLAAERRNDPLIDPIFVGRISARQGYAREFVLERVDPLRCIRCDGFAEDVVEAGGTELYCCPCAM
jgi:hypothetical protein